MVCCSSFFCALVEVGGRGVRPAAHLLSFASPKESRQRKGDPQSASPFARWAKGATCDARTWGGAAELTAFPLRANSVQTAAASQMTKCVCPSAHAPTPGPALLGAASRGGQRVPHGCCFRSCAGCRVRAARCRRNWRDRSDQAKRSEAVEAERSNGPYGARPHPLLTVPRSAGPGVSACRRTRASLSGSPKLSDRSCLAEAAQGVLRRTPGPSIAGCPTRPPGEWGHGQRGRLSFGYFSLAKQRTSTSAAGPRPGLRPLHKSRSNHRHQT